MMPTFSSKGQFTSLALSDDIFTSWLPSLVCMSDQLSVAPTGIICLACSLVLCAHLSCPTEI